jgi:selenocysteine lyase/cysteine desulfurase
VLNGQPGLELAAMQRRRFLAGLTAVAGSALAGRSATAGAADSSAPAIQSAGGNTDAAWREIRQQFQLPAGLAYFNTAGLGASPRAVTDRVKAMMDREEESPSPGHSEEDWARIRGKAATLLGAGCSAGELALVSTATEGINLILNGLPLAAGDEVITSTHEHVALAIPLLHKAETMGIAVKTFEPDLRSHAGTVDRMRALMTPRTRLVFVSHVTCTTGQVLPVSEIGRLASERRAWFALDGAQSLAQGPVDIAATGADFYTASCHKWLMGPKRTGLLFVRRDRFRELRPTVVGAYSDASNSLAARQLTLQPDARHFEYGTQNDALVYGLEAALDFVAGLGLAAIQAHGRALTEACLAGLREIPGVEILTPPEPEGRSSIVTFRLVGRDNREVANALTRRRHRVRSVTEAGLDAVRASFHVCNDRKQVEEFLIAIEDIADGE